MNQHFEDIAENLYALTARKLRPLVIVIDEENNYLSHHGDLSDYLLTQARMQENSIESLPFLVGLEEEDYVSLPLVNFDSAHVCSVNIFRINNYRYVVMLAVADEHKIQQELTQESNETKLLYEKLQRLKEELENANNVKSRFISSMSHEFRTPISSILGYSNLLTQSKELNDSEAQYADAIDRNAKHLLSLIDNVLEHAQLEKGKLLINIAPFELSELIMSIGVMFGADAERSDIEFDINTTENVPSVICSDQMRLMQILINLIGNAFKYTEQGTVSVSFDWLDNELVVIVADTGPGISVENQENIFDAFSRFSKGVQKGAGLGLNISSQLAQKLNGSLTLDSELGKGSVFTLTVQAELADSNIIQNENSELDLNKRILIVEDDKDLVELLRIYIEDCGYKTILAEDGEIAIDTCNQDNIDLILLDMQLPSLDGIEVAKKLRDTGYNLPIIAMTASSNNEDKVNALDAGCNEFLSKPIRSSALVNMINSFIK